MPKMTEDVAKKAAGFHDEFNQSLQQIRANKDLTPEGRQRQIANSFVRAKRQLDGLREDFSSGQATTAKVLAKDIFGTVSVAGADAISLRDAADRASQLSDPGEAVGVMQMAEDNGDEVLARAVAQHAYRSGKQAMFGDGAWSSVLHGYLDSRPEVAAKLEEIENAQTNDLETNFRNEAHFVLMQPVEISRFSESAVTSMATDGVPA